MPFYEGSCGVNYGVGFPLYVFSQETAEHPTVWQPLLPHLSDPVKLIGATVVVNFACIVAMALIMGIWFRSHFFQARYHKFVLSHLIIFLYTFYSFIVGWTEIAFAVLEIEETNLLAWAYEGMILPMLYLGGLIVLPISKFFNDPSPLALMPAALPVTLLILYWGLFLISWLYYRFKTKRDHD